MPDYLRVLETDVLFRCYYWSMRDQRMRAISTPVVIRRVSWSINNIRNWVLWKSCGLWRDWMDAKTAPLSMMCRLLKKMIMTSLMVRNMEMDFCSNKLHDNWIPFYFAKPLPPSKVLSILLSAIRSMLDAAMQLSIHATQNQTGAQLQRVS